MRIPTATYRLQFRGEFTFTDALKVLPYLKELGISDVYASPLFLASPESTHGYDVCGFDRWNPALGTSAEIERFVAELQKLGLGLLLDMVPNHMGSHAANRWWRDVLKKGRASRFSTYFDVNWGPADGALRGKVLLPVLGDRYAAVLERGEFTVKEMAGEFQLSYFDKAFPLSEESLGKWNPEDARNKDKLHALIEMQHYRLAYWRVGPHEINYRRFFDVTDLVSMRVEDPEVFAATHRFVFELLRTGPVTGLRIDHPDGLRDPKAYFDRLQEGAGGNLYVVAEKILSGPERLPADWPVSGTTGYDYLNYLNGIFVRAESEAAFTRIYNEFIGSNESFEEVAGRSKREVLERMFVSEINALTARLKGVASSTRHGVDFTVAELRRAMVEFIAGFPVYRTYVSEERESVPAIEKEFIAKGLAEAKRRNAGLDHGGALDFLGRILKLEWFPDMTAKARMEAREFVIRLQQLSGPAAAKGLEDTAFYRYVRFVSLNEVGGEPGKFGIRTADFHAYNRAQQIDWPNSLLATATHDTKRGEDTRARLNVLSEMPDEWEGAIGEWRELNAARKTHGAPSLNDEYLLYQVLAGTWTAERNIAHYTERIQAYMIKAMREAKSHTSWTDPDGDYEEGTRQFIAGILGSASFVKSLSSMAQEVAFFGMFNSLAQVVLKICSPGVPDFYQGTELWDLSLVDPDNRRAVDYDERQRRLKEIKSPAELLREWETGAVKQFAIATALRARNQFPEIFRGEYAPLTVIGVGKDHVIAFARKAESGMIVAVAPRFVRSLTRGNAVYPTAEMWADTRLEFDHGNQFRNLITGEEHKTVEMREIFRIFPVAILEVR